MTLHIFNPEHDIALASGLANFTAPHAGRQLRHDLGFLPALWAEEGDVVLVDDVDQAQKSYRRLCTSLKHLLGTGSLFPSKCQFAPFKVPVCSLQSLAFHPWGWDAALKTLLVRTGYDPQLLPSDGQLETIRQLSHRREAARLLASLRQEGTVGEAFECRSVDEVADLLQRYGQVVLKAPWSSSGRGVRFWNRQRETNCDRRWLSNIVERQGSVMVEPYFNKVKDFGMEFYSDGQGGVSYQGLSLFHAANGSYEGNILATENTKREMISRYLTVSMLDNIKETVCACLGSLYQGKYQGPFGLDMMIVGHANGFLLHPCVEINLRRTMGHVALVMSPQDDDIVRVMRITYSENNYKLNINRL